MAKDTNTKPAPVAAKPVAAGASMDGFTVKRQVVLPLWKWQNGVPKFFRVETPIRAGKVMNDRRPKAGKDDDGKDDKGAKGQPPMAPANLCNVVCLKDEVNDKGETVMVAGQLCQLIIGAVLQGNLEEGYPKESYVGLKFASTQTPITGKRYKGYSLAELA